MLSAKRFMRRLDSMGACSAGRLFAEGKSELEAWQQCPAEDWMLWYAIQRVGMVACIPVICDLLLEAKPRTGAKQLKRIVMAIGTLRKYGYDTAANAEILQDISNKLWTLIDINFNDALDTYLHNVIFVISHMPADARKKKLGRRSVHNCIPVAITQVIYPTGKDLTPIIRHHWPTPADMEAAKKERA